jgi:hypothetical protein
MTSLRTSILAVGLALTALASGAGAAVVGQDHLKCYKVKDPSPKGKLTVNLLETGPFNPPFTNDLGCTLKTPAKMICNPVTKTGVTPQPPNDGIGAGVFLPAGTGFSCYKVKCPKKAPFTAGIDDQFDARSGVVVKAPNMVCISATFFAGS